MNSTTKIYAISVLLMAFAAWGSTRTASASDEVSSATGMTANDIHTPAAAPLHKVRAVAQSRRLSPSTKLNLDRSGHSRVGKASFYAKMFAGRKMADGTPMQPTGNNAASLTLPLGTTAKVTNLETGKTAVVTIRDRGPYVAGRIVDLSPATAREIGLDKHAGVTKVEVAPMAVPMPDGQIKIGDGMLQASNRLDANNR
jgi:rare lipoprotein A